MSSSPTFSAVAAVPFQIGLLTYVFCSLGRHLGALGLSHMEKRLHQPSNMCATPPSPPACSQPPMRFSFRDLAALLSVELPARALQSHIIAGGAIPEHTAISLTVDFISGQARALSV